MVELDRIGRGISIGIRKRWFVERGRSGSGRGCRNDKSLDAKSTDEYLMTDAEPVRLNIALIPCKAEWALGYLNYKEIEVSVGGRPRTVTSIVSTGPTDSIFTRPRAFGKKSGNAALSPGFRTMLNLNSCGKAVCWPTTGVDVRTANAIVQSARAAGCVAEGAVSTDFPRTS
jgi:hypothetical protein